MNKFATVILSLLVVLVLTTAAGSNGVAFAEPNDVTPTEEYVEEVTPTEEEVKPTDCTPTPTQEVTATPTTTEAPTATPTEQPGPTATPAPEEKPLGGVPTMAKAGSFGQTVMNLSGVLGALSVAAGSVIYRRKNA